MQTFFISALDLAEPETYASALEILAQAGVLASDKLEIYKSMVRCRNILVHAYETIDNTIIYGIYQKRLQDFRDFLKEIRSYLNH